MNLEKRNLPNGAFVLAFGGILVKVIGALYKIPLGAMLGPIGMANFSIAYNIYSLLFVISTAGVPTAVSKMVAESSAHGRHGESEKIFYVSKIAFVGVGLFGFTALFLFADKISRIMGSADSAKAIKAISPAVFLVSISAVNRGYFQGKENMYPTAISEVLEAFGKLVFGLLAAFVMKIQGRGSAYIAAGAVFGVSIGSLFSVLYFFFKKRKKIKAISGNGIRILKKLFSLSVPITLGAAVIALTAVIDSALVMNILKNSGETEHRAKWLFGAYNYATTLFTLPSAIIATLATTLVPLVSGECAKGHRIETDLLVNSGVRLCVLISSFAVCALYPLSEGILSLLFGSGAGSDCIKLSSSLLRVLSLGIIPLSLVTVTNAVFQALGRANAPVISIAVGAVVKLLSNYALIRIPGIGIHGAAISTVLCYVVALSINILQLGKFKFLGISIFNSVMKPVFPSIALFLTAANVNKVLMRFADIRISAILSGISGALVGIFAVFVLKTLKKEDERLLFGGKNIFKFIDNG